MDRFGDIPVGYYTGTADISIPLYKVQVDGEEIPITLRYQSSGIKVADEATWVGLGWSLEPEGTIIQEVRGKEDLEDNWSNYLGGDQYQYASFMNSVGGTAFYHDGFQQGDCTKMPEPQTGAEWAGYRCGTLAWDASIIINSLSHGHGQPDVFTYNFGGYSGKFYKNPLTQEIVLMGTKSNISFYNTGQQGTYALTPNGTKYSFNIVEVNNFNGLLSGKTYKLTKIELSNGKIINFGYHDENFGSIIKQSNLILNDDGGPFAMQGNANGFSSGTRQVLESITTDDTQVIFNREGRSDLYYSNSSRLASIDIKSTLTNKKVKSFLFGYEYFNAQDNYLRKRLKLNSVKEIGYDPYSGVETTDNSKPPYSFGYDTSINLPAKNSCDVDFWGYYNGLNGNTTLIPDLDYFEYPYLPAYMNFGHVLFEYRQDLKAYRYTDNTKVSACILNRINYPTGGYTTFEYEPNSFNNQFIPNAAELFEATRHKSVSKGRLPVPESQSIQLLDIGDDCTLRIAIAFSHGSPMSGGALDTSITSAIYNGASIVLRKNHIAVKTWTPSLYKTMQEFNSNGSIDKYEEMRMIYEPDATYEIVANFPNFTYPYPYDNMAQAYCSVDFYNDTNIDKSTSHQCGLRIKDIRSYTGSNIISSHKHINYFEGKLLNNFEPIEKTTAMYANRSQTPGTISWNVGYYYRFTISGNDFGSSGGMPVGYGRVEEIELAANDVDNIGKKVFTYHNEINGGRKGFPNDPFPKNGFIANEKTYDKQLNKVAEKSYNYVNIMTNNIFFGIISANHSFGNTDLVGSGSGPSPGDPLQIAPFQYKWTYGVYPMASYAYVLENVASTEYFANGNVSTNESYTYNAKGEKSTVVTSGSNDNTNTTNDHTYTTMYFYPKEHNDFLPIEQQMESAHITNAPVQTVTKKDYTVTSISDIIFEKDASTAQHIMPKFAYSQKGAVPDVDSEKRLTYDKYDDKGNILQYTLENGVPVSIIWGYNGTRPIAKIENIAYDSISTTAISSLKTLSNTGTESQLLAALESLRTSSALNDAMFAGYAYKPLVGVSVIIDARGLKTRYYYDNFGRLKYVEDNDGNRLSENEYHYK
ncbi:hypothetical protein [Flavobacterium sp. 3HN19-14]|uniref:hypothetical protein n=1 Tax=Flavobacterium sp. 3HN19-14 TaxID=3448133 RepID=UPI003EDF2F0F